MRVLTIYAIPYPYNNNRRIHYGVLEKLSNFCDHIILTVGDKEIGRKKKDIEKAYKEYNPDIMMLYHGRSGKNSISRDAFSNIRCKKVMIDIDSWNIKETKGYDFYNLNNFDLSIQRGTYRDKELSCPTVWLPFSADENEFLPPKNEKNRKNIIGIAATYSSPVYSQRKKIMRLLKNAEILEICDKPCKSGGKYSEFLRNITVGVTSVETKDPNYTTPRAKMFEYMASKTAVFTPKFDGMKSLFPDGYEKYICAFENDCSDILVKAKKILKNNKNRQKLVNNSYRLFLENHTDYKRAEELYNILTSLLKNKKIIKKWGF